jgi:small-conductance mechanosensitive channel
LTLLPNLVLGAIFLLIVWVAAFGVGRTVHSAGHKAQMSVPLVRALERLSSIGIWILGMFAAATIVVPSFQPGSMIAGLGISSIAIGFAFKDVFQNFLAGLLLLWTQPFKVGDRIKSGDFEGTVEDVDIRATLIRTYDGERAILPNSLVYTNPILVRTAYRERRGRIEITVDRSRAAEEVRQIVTDILSETDGILHDPPPTIAVSDLKGAAMHFTVYLWSDDVVAAQDRVMPRLKQALGDAAEIVRTPGPNG